MIRIAITAYRSTQCVPLSTILNHFVVLLYTLIIIFVELLPLKDTDDLSLRTSIERMDEYPSKCGKTYMAGMCICFLYGHYTGDKRHPVSVWPHDETVYQRFGLVTAGYQVLEDSLCGSEVHSGKFCSEQWLFPYQ